MATKTLLKELMHITPIDILGTPYDLVFSERKWKYTGSPGTVNFPLRKIYIDTSIANDLVMEVLLHEITEVVKDRFTVRRFNHQSVCEMEFGVTDVFRRNPRFGKCYANFVSDSRGGEYEPKDFKKEDDADLQYELGSLPSVLKKLTKAEKKRSRQHHPLNQKRRIHDRPPQRWRRAARYAAGRVGPHAIQRGSARQYRSMRGL